MPRPRASKAKTVSKTHDLERIVKMERVNAPKQARSEQRLQDIIQALESLLDGRAFEEITIPDIAARAGCVPASIYARFRDKTSILVALHQSIRDRQLAGIDETMRADRHAELSLDESIFKIFRDLAKYYTRHRNLLRPAFLLGDTEIYSRVATNIRHTADHIAGIVRQKSKQTPPDLDRRIDLATRAAYALLQQRMVFHPQPASRQAPASDEDMAAEMTLLFKRNLSSDF
ncbi:MAG: TetR/AcrR family transcriptional regulator [bacterium]|nr:TetR/AcrR family transcriptional regulator [bacterium]